MNTKIHLMYRDADNYKAMCSVVLPGAITQEQHQKVSQHLSDGIFVIAEEVGLPDPAEKFAQRYDYPTESDHVWTTMCDWEPGSTASSMHTAEEVSEGYTNLPIETLVQRIMAAPKDECAAMARLGML